MSCLLSIQIDVYDFHDDETSNRSTTIDRELNPAPCITVFDVIQIFTAALKQHVILKYNESTHVNANES